MDRQVLALHSSEDGMCGVLLACHVAGINRIEGEFYPGPVFAENLTLMLPQRRELVVILTAKRSLAVTDKINRRHGQG